MNGTDHQMPQPWLGRVVAEANDVQDDLDLRISSLAEHLAAAPTDGLPTWRGELRSGARANLLMGVVSNRVDVRMASARAERALLSGAEPLSALFLPPARWPGALLDEAWRGVDPQLGPRLGVRLLDRRRVHGGAPPLQRGRRHRRGPGRPGGRRTWRPASTTTARSS